MDSVETPTRSLRNTVSFSSNSVYHQRSDQLLIFYVLTSVKKNEHAPHTVEDGRHTQTADVAAHKKHIETYAMHEWWLVERVADMVRAVY